MSYLLNYISFFIRLYISKPLLCPNFDMTALYKAGRLREKYSTANTKRNLSNLTDSFNFTVSDDFCFTARQKPRA